MTGHRVLLVLGTSGGGVGRHVRALERGLAAAGDHVLVAGPAATRDAFGYQAFEELDLGDRPRPVADLAAARRLRRLLREVDVVHAHGLRAGALTVLAAGPRHRRVERGRPRVLVTLHNALVGRGLTALVHALLERLVARSADVVLVVSADLGTRMRALRARRVERALVPAPARPPSGQPRDAVRAALGVARDRPLLLTVARLAPQKGLDLLLDATRELVARGIEVRVLIAGPGPLRADLQQAVDADTLPVRLLGARDDVPDLLAAADLVVVPSVWEGQPLIVQEALRAGAAVVATDVGGTREVTADAAVLVPAADPVALADAVQALLADPTAAATLRHRALERARRLPTDADAVAQVRAWAAGSARSDVGPPGG